MQRRDTPREAFHAVEGRFSLTAKAGSPLRQWTLNAKSTKSDVYTENVRLRLDAAKWELRETTDAARRALKVVNETADVAGQTLGRLYQQGQQVERAAHGIEQIDENVQHASRIVKFMGRFCCFRSSRNDPDLKEEQEWKTQEVQRQRMAGVVAAHDVAAGYASKQELVDAALAKRAAASGPAAADAAAARAAAAAAAAAAEQPWSGLIAAVPGPLGREHARGPSSMHMLGHGLEERDRQQLQAEAAKQDEYLDQISSAMDLLHGMGLAMGRELEEQGGQLEALHCRAEETGQGLRSVAAGAAKLSGAAPRRHTSAKSWHGEQDAATRAVSRAVVATAPLAARYTIR